MKIRLVTFLAAIGSAVATTAAFGQSTWIYTNINNADIGLAVSWTNAATGANGLPSGATQDTAEWDGETPGNLVLEYNTGWGNSGFGTSGVNLVTTANQTGNVQITTTLGASPAVGIFGITNNSPNGQLRIGETGSTHQLSVATRPGTFLTVHGFVNNSTASAILDSSCTWVAGGGAGSIWDFGGTGDWIVNHNCRYNNSGAGPVWLTFEGPGTFSWSPGGVFSSGDNLGPITINGGTFIFKGAGLAQMSPAGFEIGPGNNTITNNGIKVEYDAPGISDNNARVISGSGMLQVNNGTLTLSGANTYTNTTLLTGGELIAGVAENLGVSGPLGVGGTISFSGGVLGWSLNNTYDYSPRFSTAAGQQYAFDTQGQSVTLTNNLTSSGGSLTKTGSGTLTLTGANTYSGLTAVGFGKLLIQGSQASGNIIVSNSASLGVTGGAQITPGTLTVGTTGGATLEFNNVNSTSIPLIAAGTVSATSPITINVNSGTFNTIGQSFPLISWTSGTPPPVTLGTLTGAGGTLSTNGNTIQLNVTSLAFVWTGGNNGNWDTTTTGNWKLNGSPAVWQNGGTALFDDTATGVTNITVNALITAAGISVNSSTKPYSITSSGANFIGGTGSLTKNGNSTLTLSGGVNTYTGPTTILGGMISVGVLASGGTPSDIGASSSSAANLVLNGGTLQYTGTGATIDRLFTLGIAGGTIDSSGAGSLALNNSGTIVVSGTGAHTLTLTGSDLSGETLAANLGDNGGATALIKNGPSSWVLTGLSTNSGAVTINAGELQIGTGGASSIGGGNIIDNGSLDINVSGTLTLGTISGTGSVTNDGSGTLILPGNNSYTGVTTVNNGTLQVGIGGATGALNGVANIVNNGTAIIFNSTSLLELNGVISGTGNLIKRGSGLLQILGGNTYTGTTTIDPGASLQLWQGQNGVNVTSAITNNGTLYMARQDNSVAKYAGNINGTGAVVEEVSNGNAGDSTLTGTNTYTGGTYILGGGLILGDNGSTPGGGSIIGNVYITNDFAHNTFGVAPNNFVPSTLTFNRAEDIVFPGNIVGNGFVTLTGSGRVTLTGNNTYTNTGTGAATTITSGILQIGDGGADGSIGTGDIADNSELDFDRPDTVTISRVISGSGTLVQLGSGTLLLTGANTYSGATTVSNGTLVTSSTLSDLNLYGGGVVPGALGAVGSLTVGGNLNISPGTVTVALNKSLAQSNSTVSVSGTITSSGGVLKVVNVGPALTVGDTFVIFSQPVTGMTVTASGATFINNLATDGSITVQTAVATNPTNLLVHASGGQLILSWPADHTGWHLQVQTNNASTGLSTNWVTIPGSSVFNSYTNTIVPGNADVFYRMVYP